jgi:outer membrane protein assembly factor BamE (lipoprotein component of BamABCDE complex)
MINFNLKGGGMKFIGKFLCLGLVLLFMAGCVSAGRHRQDVRDDTGDKITAGRVQREIKVGMSSAEVIEVLGAPNVVTTDSQRREVWVYDKIATEHVYSTSSGGVSALIFGGLFGGAAGGGGAGSAGYQSNAGAASTSQRTLTVIIKYDEQGKVRDFAYRQSSF